VDTQWLSADKSVEENKALTRLILDNHKAANMTSVLWQVRRFGTVYFQSEIELWGPQTDFADPGYDPLQYAIQQAHERGLEFHAWFNTFESRHQYEGSPSQLNPDWICQDRDDITMPSDIAWHSPGLTGVREYLVNVAMEIINGYDIDGLHLDFIRWSEHTNSAQSLMMAKQNIEHQLPDGFITEAQANELINNSAGRYLYDVEHPFSAGVPAGFNTWEDWWRWSVTEFVRVLHDSIQAVKPWVRLSPAALGRYNWGGWQGFDIVYQDAALWLNEKYIDQLIGMHYHWNRPEDFLSVLQTGCPNCWSQFIQPAIQMGQLYTVGLFSDNFAAANLFNRHAPIVNTVRGVSWVDGLQFFSYESWRDQRYWEDAKTLFFNRKTKIRATGLIDDVPPDAPSNDLTKLDSLNYEIAVTPPPSIDGDHWFGIYRSPDDQFDQDNDEIINIRFGSSQYSYIDRFTGLQDYDGTYHYFATVLDRFWNESNISGATQSDSIPSFAPIVVSTMPTEGDTVPVTEPLVLVFSKTMDVNTLQNAISISPVIGTSQTSWSADHKTVTIAFPEDLEYDTDYVVTISPSATDINGKPLDGNGDGIAGDSFVFHFTTEPFDIVGPQILGTHPSYETANNDFDVQDIITILFDEMVEPTTLNDTTVTLHQGENEVAIAYNLATVDEKLVLNAQPLHQLQIDTEYSLFLSQIISDTLGNPMDSDLTIAFRTSNEYYSELNLIDNFISLTNWRQPSWSGSTTGIYVPNTALGISGAAYLPATEHPLQHNAPALRYEWDETASEFLIRVFLAGGQPRSVLFDTTFVLQCYVFGDASLNSLRFALDDSTKDRAEFHEVSKWIRIDWYGWRLVEWDLGDPNSVGQWIGDGVLNGPSLRFDSFQLTHESGNAVTGRIFFDNLRLAKKSPTVVHVARDANQIPDRFRLYQNYPNPFNPTTTISFDISQDGLVKIAVYDLLGREVENLINKPMQAGNHKIQFDGSGLASGVCFYRLTFDRKTISRRMLLAK
jgi:uncharacterized lipoprotein YddW (UPF0748 family)